MKTRLSLVVAVAVAALSVGVPTAFGDDWFTRSNQPVDAVSYFRANELSTAAASESSPAPYVDAFERPPVQATIQDPATTSASGSGIAWTQIAVALGFGLLIALGLVLAIRRNPSRPLPQ